MKILEIKKINLILLTISLISFLFLWDISIGLFNLRYLIVLPIFSILLIWRYNKLKNIFFSIIFPSFITFHFLIMSFFLKYEIELRDIFGLIFLYFIFIIINYFRPYIDKCLKNSLNIFIFVFTIIFILFFFIQDLK